MTSHSLFAGELRRAREEAGLTQPQLAEALAYSPSLVAMIETGKRAPSEDFAKRADDVLKTDGLLTRIRRHSLRQESVPDWFRAWPEIEQQATLLRWFEPLLVPGLLQTEAYARALLRDDDRVAMRMERQEILAEVSAPELIAVIDHVALERQVGDREVMAEQLQRLAEPPSTARVRVLPASADTYLGMDGSFILATVDGREYVYVETPARSFLLEGPEVASTIRHSWEALLGEALPVNQSRDLILEMSEQWKTQS